MGREPEILNIVEIIALVLNSGKVYMLNKWLIELQAFILITGY